MSIKKKQIIYVLPIVELRWRNWFFTLKRRASYYWFTEEIYERKTFLLTTERLCKSAEGMAATRMHVIDRSNIFSIRHTMDHKMLQDCGIYQL
jgi:hypothetical protein